MRHTRTYHIDVVHGRGVSHHGQPFPGFCGRRKFMVGVALTAASGGDHYEYVPIYGVMKIQTRQADVEDDLFVRLLEY